MMRYRLEHIKADLPTANERTYSKEVLQKMVDDAQVCLKERTLVIRQNSSDSPNAGHFLSEDILGVVTGLEFDGECIVVDADAVGSRELPRAIDFSATGTIHEKVVEEISELKYFYAVPPDRVRPIGGSHASQ